MTDERRFFPLGWPRRRRGGDEAARAAPRDPLDETEALLTATLSGAVRASDPLLETAAHASRVASLASWLAAELNVDPGDREVLRAAARLHEIGMVAVPPHLLDKPAPLTPEELDRVRAQAWIGAGIVEAVHDARLARLVEHQYCDYEELRDHYAANDVDLLLAGILRVADVFDAMCYPRPYQHDLSEAYRAEVLRSGLGTKFHPSVTRLMLRNAM